MSFIDNLYNPLIQSLFIMSFEDIINKYTNDLFLWKNIKNIFEDINDLILKSNTKEDFIKYYYLLTILYINYTNYLKYSNNSDFDNNEIYNFIHKIKFNKNIIKKIFLFSLDKNIRLILKIENPFINLNINKINNEKYIEQNILEHIKNSKQIEKLSEMDNFSSKKILNIIIFRYVICKNNNYNNYSEFIVKKIFNKNIDLVNFNNFITLIPLSKNILLLKTQNSSFSINITLNKIINFYTSNFPKITVEYNKNNIILINKKYNGKIIIKYDTLITTTEFNNYQINYNLMYFNFKELKEFSFLKKTNSFIEIKLNSNIITDLSSLLEIFHLLTISFKILESYPTDINECIYPLDMTNYYYQTFCIFLEFLKPQIKTNPSINKFIVDLIKYLYIYSYYDYYFYFSNNLMETIIANYVHKHEIFNEFTNNIKNIMKFPKELFNYPPFMNINDDINSIIYYNFEIPSYFKFLDLINAIIYVFDYKYSNLSIITLVKECFNISIDNKSKQINYNKKVNKVVETTSSELSYSTSSNNSELVSKLDDNILINLSPNNKNLITKKNSYIELNVENSINYIFDTEK
jgi:hypothetical protein